MKATHDRYLVASALSAAFDVVIDVCLETGITSPELESMLRAQFVHRALMKLPRRRLSTGKPSDLTVALTVGIHRLDVKRIREGGTEARMKHREQRYWKGGKILRGWTQDPHFASRSGHPLDLPVEILCGSCEHRIVSFLLS